VYICVCVFVCVFVYMFLVPRDVAVE